ncbi:MAG: uroporphyrinogen decarboxylase [Bacteroidetes bacterium]|nr:uroporphyrinogen decarboxylase [Bacteroidota bacterium]
MLKNDLLLRAARGEAVERTPVWVMRQAGRILPEYRAIRQRLSGFKELVTTPDLVAEVTIQPVDRLGVDAAIIFSDILVIPEALGLDYEMIEKKGPFFPHTIQSKTDVDRLIVDGVEERLDYVRAGLEITKRELNGRVPLIGFAGAPWTIFAYMVEGSGSKTFSKAKRLLYTDPDTSHALLSKITEATIRYLKMQVRSGADIVQVFDSWAGILDRNMYLKYAIPYLERICLAITEVPVIIFSKGAYFSIEDLAKLDCEVLGMDWSMSVEDFRKATGGSKTLQGNMDPCVLYADKETIKMKTAEMLAHFGDDHHIANLGHGVYPDTPWENVKYYIDLVKELSAK